MNDLTGALSAFNKALPIRQEILATDPDDARARLNLVNSHAAVGVTLLKLKRGAEALSHFEAQRDLVEQLMVGDRMRIEYHTSLSEAHENIGLVAMLDAERTSDLGQKIRHLRTARAQLVRALELYDALQARNAVSAEYAAVPGRIRQELAQCDRAREKLSNAG